MTELLCRNRVKDYGTWRKIFDSHASAHRQAGLKLTRLWRDVQEPNDVFFLFQVSSLEKARAFIEDPSAAEVGAAAGVIDGAFHFLERREGY